MTTQKSLSRAIALAALISSPLAFAESIEKNFNLTDFDSVIVKGPVMVDLKQTGTESVSVVADEEVFNRLYAKVSNGTLEVGVKEKMWKMFDFDSDITFTIEVDDLSKLSVEGSADVQATNLSNPRLAINSSGATSIKTGTITAEQLKLYVSGAGDLFTDAIEAESLAMRISGSGDVKVNDVVVKTADIELSGSADALFASFNGESLEAGISGAGTIKIKGTGQVDKQYVRITGAGDYIAKELKSKNASIKLTGAAEATVYVTDMLKGRLSGASDINYYGTPVVDVSTSGSSDVSYKGKK